MGYAQKIILGILHYMPVEDPGALTGLVPVLQRAVIFFACLPSSPEGYAGQVILIKNSNLWVDTIEKEKVIERE